MVLASLAGVPLAFTPTPCLISRIKRGRHLLGAPLFTFLYCIVYHAFMYYFVLSLFYFVELLIIFNKKMIKRDVFQVSAGIAEAIARYFRYLFPG